MTHHKAARIKRNRTKRNYKTKIKRMKIKNQALKAVIQLKALQQMKIKPPKRKKNHPMMKKNMINQKNSNLNLPLIAQISHNNQHNLKSNQKFQLVSQSRRLLTNQLWPHQVLQTCLTYQLTWTK